MNRITKIKVLEMYKAYVESDGNIEAVAKACNVNPKTVSKHRDKEGWKAALEAIYAKERAKIDINQSGRIKDNLSKIRGVISKITESMDKGEVKYKASELLDAIQLEEKLCGNQDAKEDTIINVTFTKPGDED